MHLAHSSLPSSSVHLRAPNSQGPSRTQVLQRCLLTLRFNSRSFQQGSNEGHETREKTSMTSMHPKPTSFHLGNDARSQSIHPPSVYLWLRGRVPSALVPPRDAVQLSMTCMYARPNIPCGGVCIRNIEL